MTQQEILRRTDLIISSKFFNDACKNYTKKLSEGVQIFDWGCLMDIVVEIEKGNFGFKICRKVVEIYYDDSKEIIMKFKEEDKYMSLFMAVTSFIQWYNDKYGQQKT